MLENVISEGKGHRTARRTVQVHPSLVVEVSFEEKTKMLGHEGVNIGTYTSSPKPDGSLGGIGKGVVMLTNGELVAWDGLGAGTIGANGKIRYVGCLTYSTTSKELTHLNGVAGVFEFESDMEGATHSKVWQWK